MNYEKKSAITDHVNQENHVINWNEAMIIARESDKTTRWIREAVKIRQESQGVMNRDEGPTSWATSLWRPLAEDSKQQFEQDSSCCRNVTKNLVSY